MASNTEEDIIKAGLLDLLCIIHRDGGQYISTHGIEKAIEDAKKIASNAIVKES